jgi:hypothetical protein
VSQFISSILREGAIAAGPAVFKFYLVCVEASLVEATLFTFPCVYSLPYRLYFIINNIFLNIIPIGMFILYGIVDKFYFVFNNYILLLGGYFIYYYIFFVCIYWCCIVNCR